MTHTKVYGKGQQTSSKWPDSKFGGSFAGHGICLDYPTLPLEYEMNHSNMQTNVHDCVLVKLYL